MEITLVNIFNKMLNEVSKSILSKLEKDEYLQFKWELY